MWWMLFVSMGRSRMGYEQECEWKRWQMKPDDELYIQVPMCSCIDMCKFSIKRCTWYLDIIGTGTGVKCTKAHFSNPVFLDERA